MASPPSLLLIGFPLLYLSQGDADTGRAELHGAGEPSTIHPAVNGRAVDRVTLADLRDAQEHLPRAGRLAAERDRSGSGNCVGSGGHGESSVMPTPATTNRQPGVGVVSRIVVPLCGALPRQPGSAGGGCPSVTRGSLRCVSSNDMCIDRRIDDNLYESDGARQAYAGCLLLRIGVTTPAPTGVFRNRAHSSIIRVRFANRSPRRYAASTLSPMVCASAISATSRG